MSEPIEVAGKPKRAKKLTTTVRLTARFVETAKPLAGKDRTDYRDAGQPGLLLRVSATSTSFMFGWQDGDRYRRMVLNVSPDPNEKMRPGDDDGPTLRQARKIVSRLRHKLDTVKGFDPTAPDDEAKTLRWLASEFIERHAKHEKRSWEADAWMIEKHIPAKLLDTLVADIRRGDIVVVLEAIARGGDGAPRMADRVGGLINSLWNWGIQSGTIETGNPATKLARYYSNEGRDRYLSDDEIKTVWAKLPEIFEDEQCQIMVKLLLLTGCRKNEIMGAIRSELALDGKSPLFSIPGVRVKNGEDHTVALAPLAVVLFRRALELAGGSEYVFPSNRTGEKYSDKVLNKKLVWAMAGKKRKHLQVGGKSKTIMVEVPPILGVEHFTLHDLRRTCATGMAALKIDDRIISRALNHTTGAKATITSKRYIKHLYEAERAEAFATWAAHIERLVVPQGVQSLRG